MALKGDYYDFSSIEGDDALYFYPVVDKVAHDMDDVRIKIQDDHHAVVVVLSLEQARSLSRSLGELLTELDVES